MSHETQPQDALAGLRKWRLERDDISDPGGRVYRDKAGTVYHSVTRILSATAPAAQQAALQRWLERPDSERDRAMAAERGTQAHNHAEYILKTAKKMAIHTANKRNAFKTGCDGLERPPSAITAWALQKAIQGAPRPAWSASGFARGLRHWIEANVTAIHAVEFSVFASLTPSNDGTLKLAGSPFTGCSAGGSEQSERPIGFAGTADGLFDIQGTLCICDWKTTKKSIHGDMSATLEGYKAQAGAYSLGLTHLTGIVAPSAAIVVARRTGAPSVTVLGEAELRQAEDDFLQRVARYFLALNPPH